MCTQIKISFFKFQKWSVLRVCCKLVWMRVKDVDTDVMRKLTLWLCQLSRLRRSTMTSVWFRSNWARWKHTCQPLNKSECCRKHSALNSGVSWSAVCCYHRVHVWQKSYLSHLSAADHLYYNSKEQLQLSVNVIDSRSNAGYWWCWESIRP